MIYVDSVFSFVIFEVCIAESQGHGRRRSYSSFLSILSPCKLSTSIVNLSFNMGTFYLWTRAENFIYFVSLVRF